VAKKLDPYDRNEAKLRRQREQPDDNTMEK
jgi:hypothetical protein